MKTTCIALIAVMVVGLITVQQAAGINIPLSEVGNPNPILADHTSPLGGTLGNVDHVFYMGTYEVRNIDYAEFLDSIAESDPQELWHTAQKITRSGSDGSYTYAANAGFAQMPVGQVSWLDAARFANWLHNGATSSSDTEDGAYDMDGAHTRKAGAKWFLPNNDEWHKAAFHEPGASPPGNLDYWDYHARRDTEPVVATVDAFGNVTAGELNYQRVGLPDGGTPFVNAGQTTPSFYGVHEMGGNITEWMEDLHGPANHGLRGGSWENTPANPWMHKSNYSDWINTTSDDNIGFRVASIVSAAGIPGDITGNGTVDAEDLALVRQFFGSNGGGDANDDGRTDAEDLAIVRTNFGQSAGSVPEPAALGLLALGVLALRRRPRGA